MKREATIVKQYKELLTEKNDEIRSLKDEIKELESINDEINNQLEDVKNSI